MSVLLAHSDASFLLSAIVHVHEGHPHAGDGAELKLLLKGAARNAELMASLAWASLSYARIWSRKHGAELPGLLSARNEWKLAAGSAVIFFAAGLLSAYPSAWTRLLLAAVGLLLAVAFGRRRRRGALALNLATAVGLLGTFPASLFIGEARDEAVLLFVLRLMQLLSAAVWLGGLAVLLVFTLAKYSERISLQILSDVLSRYIPVSFLSITVMFFSTLGTEVGLLWGWPRSAATPRGYIALFACGLLLIMTAIACFQSRVIVPRLKLLLYSDTSASARKEKRRLQQTARLQINLSVIWILLASVLSGSPQAAASGAKDAPVYWHEMGKNAHMSLRMEGIGSLSQKLRLDVWLPRKAGEPVTVLAELVKEGYGPVDVPFFYLRSADSGEYAGFVKYTYASDGFFLDKSGIWKLSVQVRDRFGNMPRFERFVDVPEGDALCENE